jgi:RNA recognition motif-containing protein
MMSKDQRKKEIQKKFEKQNLVIHNLPEDTTQEDLEKFFGNFGPLINVKVFTTPVANAIGEKKVKCTGVGFVCY